MAIITSKGTLISSYAHLSPECLAQVEKSGGFSKAALKRFRKVDRALDTIVPYIGETLINLPKNACGDLDLIIHVKNGKVKRAEFYADDHGRIILST